jgi:hypothetical protein
VAGYYLTFRMLSCGWKLSLWCSWTGVESRLFWSWIATFSSYLSGVNRILSKYWLWWISSHRRMKYSLSHSVVGLDLVIVWTTRESESGSRINRSGCDHPCNSHHNLPL